MARGHGREQTDGIAADRPHMAKARVARRRGSALADRIGRLRPVGLRSAAREARPLRAGEDQRLDRAFGRLPVDGSRLEKRRDDDVMAE